MIGFRWLFAMILMLIAMVFSPGPARAAGELRLDFSVSLTTGVLTLAATEFSTFYVPAGEVLLRSVDNNTSGTAQAQYQYFPYIPEADELDGSTREKTGNLIQEGDVLRIRTPGTGWIGVRGVVGVSHLVAMWLIE